MDERHEYLGDGVYTSFDGYYIWLAANHHKNKVVALEPEVFDKLVDYNKKIRNDKSSSTDNNSTQ